MMKASAEKSRFFANLKNLIEYLVRIMQKKNKIRVQTTREELVIMSGMLRFFNLYLRTRHSRTLFETVTPASQRISLKLKLDDFRPWVL
jgi:DNA polymerase III delta prime subunit